MILLLPERPVNEAFISADDDAGNVQTVKSHLETFYSQTTECINSFFL